MLLKSITILTGVAGRAAPWLRQTSTITGISALIGLCVAVLTGEMTWQAALPVAAGAIVAMVLPGHPEAQTVFAQVAVDAAALANPATRGDAVKALVRDVPSAVRITATTEKLP